MDNTFDDLTSFLQWWLSTRHINTPNIEPITFAGQLNGVVLYRQDNYQVQLFIVQPNSVIEPHIHPNVDSYEVFVGGDINFMCDGQWMEQKDIGRYSRVTPSTPHGGTFGERGGCFLSVQKWLNGVPPTSVGYDWHDTNNNTTGTAYKAAEVTTRG